MRRKLIGLILGIVGLAFTGWGIYLLIKGDLTNGLLSLILGELLALKRRLY